MQTFGEVLIVGNRKIRKRFCSYLNKQKLGSFSKVVSQVLQDLNLCVGLEGAGRAVVKSMSDILLGATGPDQQEEAALISGLLNEHRG